jgi:hypothetical protein
MPKIIKSGQEYITRHRYMTIHFLHIKVLVITGYTQFKPVTTEVWLQLVATSCSCSCSKYGQQLQPNWTFKKFFSKVPNHPDLADWLEGSPDAPSDVDIWGDKKGSYHFKDLEIFMEHDRKMKMKKKVKGNKSNKGEGGSKKAGDKKKKQVNN